MTQMQTAREPDNRLRMLECWLPLAQEMNRTCGWGYEPPTIERLLLTALPDLSRTRTIFAARAVLWYHFWQSHLPPDTTPSNLPGHQEEHHHAHHQDGHHHQEDANHAPSTR